MTIFSILETLLIGPLKLVFEVIYVMAYNIIGHPALAIVVLSLAMNILVLPLYRRADIMQEEARDIDLKLRDGVTHIKKTFSGDERMMILQAYYRQNNYKPTDALNGSVSLLLEIPFFMAAYQFLSNLDLLQGVSFGPIADLGVPDGLLTIGALTINVLPFVMTLVNVISSAIYLKGFPLKTKIQLYGMALFFLVFLYNSPAGLLFYWTLNNVFSLGKTLFFKIKHAKQIGAGVLSVCGVAALIFGLFFYHPTSMKRKLFVIALGFILLAPLALCLFKDKVRVSRIQKTLAPNKKLFLLGSIFLTVLVGLLIPSTVIAASPQEFIEPSYFFHPLLYIVNTLLLSAGTFLVWLRVFYWLSAEKTKAVFDRAVWVLCGIMLVNYMFFGTKLGVLSPNLQYENKLIFTLPQQAGNLLILFIVAVVFLLCMKKWPKAVSTIMLTGVLAICGMSSLHMVDIKKSVENYTQVQQDSTDAQLYGTLPAFELSKTGQNVVVIMLDRAQGYLVPFIFNEHPQLKEQFAGFTHYQNTISYGGCTNFAIPPLYGGYEYTPVEMNRHNDRSLMEKHNEALCVMPVLFAQNDYDVTLFDPVYANYQWISDLSVFDSYPEIDAYLVEGMIPSDYPSDIAVNARNRNFFCFSIMKSMPLCVQSTIYNSGQYNRAEAAATQIQHSASTAEGLNPDFMAAYSVLQNLVPMTQIVPEQEQTFFFLANNTTHEGMLLQTPQYSPASVVDNTQYDTEHAARFQNNDMTLQGMDSTWSMAHYHSNVAAYMQLGQWFDYLRQEGVWDNTRIILVSDHGADLKTQPDFVVNMDEETVRDLLMFNPLLMVKDFGADEFTTSDTFMTNADVVMLATEDLIEDPVNPFTGIAFDDTEKTAHEQLIITSFEFDVETNNGNAFFPSYWVSVKDNLWNRNNWSVTTQETILTEHKLP